MPRRPESQSRGVSAAKQTRRSSGTRQQPGTHQQPGLFDFEEGSDGTSDTDSAKPPSPPGSASSSKSRSTSPQGLPPAADPAPSTGWGNSDDNPPEPAAPPQGTALLPRPEAAESLRDAVVVLVDAHSLIYQVFHALPPMTSPAGIPVAAVHGFVGDMLELIRRKSPAYMICAFDKSDVTFRNELYDQYKAHRESMPDELRQQIPLVREAIEAMGIGVMECGGFEADDILATVAKQVEAAGGTCLIVTGDKDCRQLITDRVRLYNIRKNEEMNAEGLLADWGIRPDQVVDYQALVGDPVDNVPGIPLIGPKLARQLLNQFDNLEAVLDNADSISGTKRKENLKAGRERAMLSRQLVRLRDDVPCTPPWDASRMQADLPKLADMMETYGFRRLRTRLEDVFGRAAMVVAEAAPPPERHYEAVTDLQQLDRLVERLAKCTEIAIDTETTGTSPRSSELVGISIAWESGCAAYLPILAPRGEPTLPLAEVFARLAPILQNESIAKIGQNLKFDLIVLRTAGLEVRGPLSDTMVADYLISPGGRNHTLDDLARRYLNHETIKIKELIGTGKQQRTMDQVPLALVTDYACEDVDVPLQVLPQLAKELDGLGLQSLYRDLEMPLIEVLAEMEFNGIRIDVEYLQQMSDVFARRIEELKAEIFAAAGSEFNLESPKQLAKVLFEDLGLPVVKRTKTGASTDVEVLQTLAATHPPAAKLIAYRQATKLKGTYIDALPRLVNPKTGRVHTSFRQDVAATGRLSSSDPNLQNIPIRTAEGRAIRGAFRAGPDDWLLLGADYSQIELRMLAHYSQDPALVNAYASDSDIHTRVAAEVNGVDESQVTADMRRTAKTINFGIVYGQSPYGLARTLGISKDEAAEYIELYFARYPGVQQFMLQTLLDCRREGYVKTILGRRRNVQGVRDFSRLEPHKRRSLTEAERIAVNTVIQGSAADLIKQAMIAIHRRLAESHLQAKLLLQIHDELIFEVAPDDAESLQALICEEMTGVMTLRVPLKVESGFGKTWADLK